MMNCCTDLYQLPLTHLLLGESFHPGGLNTTRSLARQTLVNRDSNVLDIATGRATSAIFLVKEYGANLLALDRGIDNLAQARQRFNHPKLQLIGGDAQQLPLADNSLDIVFCECALCTFDDRELALQEIYRVLKPDGFVAISDIFLNQPLPAKLGNTLSRWLCVSGALTDSASIKKVRDAKFTRIKFEDNSTALLDTIDSIKHKLAKLQSLPLYQSQLAPWQVTAEYLNTLVQIASFIRQGGAGYYTLSARK